MADRQSGGAGNGGRNSRPGGPGGAGRSGGAGRPGGAGRGGSGYGGNRDGNDRRDAGRSGGYGRDGAGRNDGPRKPGDGRPSTGRPGAPRDGERREWKPREGGSSERREWKPREGGSSERREWKPREGGPSDRRPAPRDGERREWKPREGGSSDRRPAPRDGERREWKPREGGSSERREWKPREGGSSERREWKPREGGSSERREWKPREGGPARPARDGERREWKPREGGSSDRRSGPRDGERREWKPREGGPARPARDGERREWKPREGGSSDRRPPRDGDRRPSARSGYGDRPAPRSDGQRDERPELTPEQLRARELRPVRKEHEDLPIDEDVTLKELERGAFNELKALTEENATFVGEHLVMAARLLEVDPEAAHHHAVSASRRGGRIAVVRETLGITAYVTGDFALALRELRTFNRISGSFDQIGLMVDCERGVGRPEKALELGRSVDRSKLSDAVQATLAIAMSGARLDLGQADLALAELEIPQLKPDTVFSYSPDLFRAYAEVLAELGRDKDAKTWNKRAEIAEAALEETYGSVHEMDDQEVLTEWNEPEESEAVEPEAAELVEATKSLEPELSVHVDAETEVAELLGEVEDASETEVEKD